MDVHQLSFQLPQIVDVYTVRNADNNTNTTLFCQQVIEGYLVIHHHLD